MHTYPHKIENGEGEVLTFFGVFVIETAIAVGTAGYPVVNRNGNSLSRCLAG